MSESVPTEYVPAKWVAVFSKRELQHLAEKLDASNRELRIVNQSMRQHLALYQQTERQK